MVPPTDVKCAGDIQGSDRKGHEKERWDRDVTVLAFANL